MQKVSPHHFTLSIRGPEKERRILQKLQNGKAVKFSKPLTNNKLPKIYVIKHNNEIVYVGSASQSIGMRLGQGLRAKGKNGYKWKKHDEVELIVFVLKPFTGDEDQNKKDKVFAEAVEAELVFLIRSKTGKWPENQNEIHFNNDSPTIARALAKQMFEYALSHIAICDK